MGKKIIIKGADFSANALDTITEWYTNKIESLSCNRNFRNYRCDVNVPAFYGQITQEHIGVPINVVRTKFVNTGVDAEHSVSKDVLYGVYRGKIGQKPVLVKNFYLTDEQIESNYLEVKFSEIILDSDEMITISGIVASEKSGGTIGFPLGRAETGTNFYYFYPQNDDVDSGIVDVDASLPLSFIIDCGYIQKAVTSVSVFN